MKITLKTNRLISIATIVYTVFLAISLILKVRYIIIPPLLFYTLIFIIEVLYLLLLIYLVRVLIALKEKISISSAFTMYTWLVALQIIGSLLPSRVLGNFYSIWIGTLHLVLTVYVVFQTFKIQNQLIAFPYKLFGSSLLYLLLAKLILTIAFPRAANREMINYLDVLSLLTPIAILYILKKVAEFIKYDNDQNSRVISG